MSDRERDALLLLKDYQAWVAAIIENDECWRIGALQLPTPCISQSGWDDLIVLQEQTNDLLFGGTGTPAWKANRIAGIEEP